MTRSMHVPKLLLLLSLLGLPLPGLASPTTGDVAPAFRLQDQKGNWHELADYQGQWVVLYFYPKDFTPGCTTEACNFRDDILRFKAMGVKILGVSVDDVESHEEFAAEHELPFSLLADMDMKVSAAYGVLRDSILGKIANRETFVIDPQGRIAKHYAKVNADEHSAQLLQDLAEFTGKSK